MQFKLKSTKTVEEVETIELETPAFFQLGDSFYKINGEEDYEIVTNSRAQTTVGNYRVQPISTILKLNRTSEAAFENAKQEALSKLFRDSFLSATEPATDAEIREKIEADGEPVYSDDEDHGTFELTF